MQETRTKPTRASGADRGADDASLAELARVEQALARGRWPDKRAIAAASAAARARAHERPVAEPCGEAERWRTRLLFAGETLGELAGGLARRGPAARRLVAALDEHASLARIDLAREAFRAPSLAALPPRDAVEGHLGLLLALAPVSSATVWGPEQGTHQPVCTAHLGSGSPSAPMHKLAGALLARKDAATSAKAQLVGLAIEGSAGVLGALTARADPRQGPRALAFLREALPTLAVALERDALLRRNLADERAVLEASERKLTRLGFDLHDGPLQDIVLLGADLRMLADQLRALLADERAEHLLRGRLEDLEAQLIALEEGLRLISTSAHATTLTSRPFRDTVRSLTDSFASRASFAPRLTLAGDLDSISASQRIALLSVVHEALNNVREHSGASEVEVTVALDATGVRARVVDNGRGFDVERMLLSAARRGRIGLAGIHERVRLLGGECALDSRPGGPTAITIALPLWEPLASSQSNAARAA